MASNPAPADPRHTREPDPIEAPRSDWCHRHGPWAVVTGASEGIGRAFAHNLADRGIDLVFVPRRGPMLQSLADELLRAHGIRCRVLVADLAGAEGIAAVIAGTADVDVGLLVAAAGFGTSGPLLRSSADTEREMLDVNCAAVLALYMHFGARLAGRAAARSCSSAPCSPSTASRARHTTRRRRPTSGRWRRGSAWNWPHRVSMSSPRRRARSGPASLTAHGCACRSRSCPGS
jgi:NAD(P)-dependent dehydrogenase (short-subunit alcohol dehydrogenase family)